jgi:PAS domain S-box-containing protein
MRFNLNFKFSLLIGVISFVIAFGVGQYSNSVSTKQLEENSGEALVKLSKRVADILDREMLERYREIKFAATMPVLTNENVSKDEKRAFLEKIKGNYNHHEWIGYALPDGTVFAGTNRYLEGKNASARPWLPAGLKGPYIGDVHDALLLAKLLPNNSGEAIYFSDVAFPVKNNDGKVLGVLCTHLMWQWTRDVIRSIQKENSVDIFLLSKDGLVLVGPNDSERKHISEISKNAANTFNHENEMHKIISWEGGNRYLSAHAVSKGFEEYKGFGWKVIVRQPVENAFKIAKNNTQQILMASLLAAIIGIVLGVILSNMISAPLNRLSKLVNDLRENKDVKFDKKIANDEIGNLQQAIKNLHDSLDRESKLKDMAEEKVQISLKIFDQSLEGIIITDKDNKIILSNKAFTDITGYGEDEVYQKDPSVLSSGTLDKEFYENMWNTIVSQGKWEGTITNKRKDGSLYEEHLKISTLKDNNGEIIYYFATFNSGF